MYILAAALGYLAIAIVLGWLIGGLVHRAYRSHGAPQYAPPVPGTPPASAPPSITERRRRTPTGRHAVVTPPPERSARRAPVPEIEIPFSLQLGDMFAPESLQIPPSILSTTGMAPRPRMVAK